MDALITFAVWFTIGYMFVKGINNLIGFFVELLTALNRKD